MNYLQHETSPYLLQHASNPVDWYAWRPEAFERARAEQKPILVSIGYSTCHWCHVMERESFENEDIAMFMNENFINIKVDREERPDVDAIYMEACQILTGGGGWPLNCFLTPDGKPFYAGTYFPPRPAFNRPSWLQLLQHISNIWETKRDVALDQAEKLLAHISRNDDIFIQKFSNLESLKLSGPETFKTSLLESIFYRMREQFDRVEGGFGGAPKFPSTMAIQYLLNYHFFTAHPEALEHALLSLDKMIGGGIYDQIGGGFARYATDRAWLVPHFEKMLYDNALLVIALSEAYKLTGKALYKETIEETLEYVRREMTHPDGGFYAAQDADSEGVEGKFYVWDKAEINAVLKEEAPLFCAFYGVTEEGNWEEKNILWRPSSFEAFASANDMELELLRQRLGVCREKLFEVRSKRIWPGLDNKILLSWNALMASAHAAAFTALGREDYRVAAVRNVEYLLSHYADETSATLKHSASQKEAFLEDYAFFIAALTDLYQITFNVRYLQIAGKYADVVLSYFYDRESGLFFYTDIRQSDIVLRKKDLYDNATPSGNSTMAHNLQRLGILLDRREWRATGSEMPLKMRESVERYPLSFERWATAMMNEVYPMHEIAVIGDNAEEKALAIQRMFLPNKVVAASRVPEESIPLLAEKSGNADALIYVCRDFACQRPVSDLSEFRQMVQPE
ncbi:MAG: hypothetical protein EPGJADBJ_00960 [Saprospiraceae bacterium]|nr:hypothetical protein [Saprospiraceae bacterium]